MENSKIYAATNSQYFKIIGVILLATIVLFALDKDTHSPRDYFKPINLVALLIYVVPTIVISFLLFSLFLKKRDRRSSMVLALLTGIPLGFVLVIITFLVFRH